MRVCSNLSSYSAMGLSVTYYCSWPYFFHLYYFGVCVGGGGGGGGVSEINNYIYLWFIQLSRL